MENVNNRMDSFNRFQEIRQQALSRQSANPRAKLLDVIDQKKAETGPENIKTGKLNESKMEPPGGLINKTLKTASELLLYDQKVNQSGETSGSKNLGNYIDMVG